MPPAAPAAGSSIEQPHSCRSKVPDDGTAVLLRHPGPVRVAIANLQDQEVAVMRRADLVDLIRMASLTFLSGDVARRVEFLGRKDLLQLAFLVRRCCRNEFDLHRHQRGKPMLWRDLI